MITLIIKNSLIPAACKQAELRGIKLNSCERLSRNEELIATADNQYLDNIVQWFCEVSEPPFPKGTLLLYQIQDSFKLHDKRTRR